MTFPHGIDLSIDWHCHLLPGLDDGPATLEESLDMARLLSSAGTRIVHCTPHYIKGSYEHTPDEIRLTVETLQAELNKQEIELELRAGREYLLDEFFLAQLNNPLPLGDSNLLLVESPPALPEHQLKELIFSITRAGLVPLVAHPERNHHFVSSHPPSAWLPQWLPSSHPQLATSKLTQELSDMGCHFQANLGSLTGYYGHKVLLTAEHFFRKGAYTYFGSDAHSLTQCTALLSH